MTNLAVSQNQADYLGLYSRPLFSAWEKPRALLEGLFDALQGLHDGGAGAFRIDGAGDNPGELVITAALAQITARFRLDRFETTIANFDEGQLTTLTRALEATQKWLRGSVKGFAFRSHLLSYASHCTLSSGDTRDFLVHLTPAHLPVLGQNTGTGLIYHSENVERQLRIQLTLDHSLSVKGGLFIHYVLITERDAVDPAELIAFARESLVKALESIGLALAVQS